MGNADALRGVLASIERARPTIRRLILANLYALLALELSVGWAVYMLWPEPVTFARYEDDGVEQTAVTAVTVTSTHCLAASGSPTTLTVTAAGAATNAAVIACWYTAP